MLKRMFWLALSCVIFFLLLGLMVQHDTMIPPVSAQVQAQSALLPVRLQLSSIEYSYEANAEIHPFVFCQVQNIVLFDIARVLPLQPYYLQNYHAFHYSDEAG